MLRVLSMHALYRVTFRDTNEAIFNTLLFDRYCKKGDKNNLLLLNPLLIICSNVVCTSCLILVNLTTNVWLISCLITRQFDNKQTTYFHHQTVEFIHIFGNFLSIMPRTLIYCFCNADFFFFTLLIRLCGMKRGFILIAGDAN